MLLTPKNIEANHDTVTTVNITKCKETCAGPLTFIYETGVRRLLPRKPCHFEFPKLLLLLVGLALLFDEGVEVLLFGLNLGGKSEKRHTSVY